MCNGGRSSVSLLKSLRSAACSAELKHAPQLRCCKDSSEECAQRLL